METVEIRVSLRLTCENGSAKMVFSEEERKRLYKIRKTLLEILRDRGYIVTDVEVDMTFKQFTEKFSENMKREDLMITKSKRDGSEQVFLLSVRF